MHTYMPREDSELIKKHVPKYAKGIVLDMGTGSGILAKEAAKNADFVIGLDINPEAVNYCKKKFDDEKILFYKSDLFQIFELGKIKRKFDLIIFNPPYLPNDKYPDKALDGGKEGYEVVKTFLEKAKSYLNKKGKILLLISSLTKKNKVEEIMKNKGYRFEVVDKKKFAFETLYVYVVE